MDPTTAKGICIGIFLVVTLIFGCIPHVLLTNKRSSSVRAEQIRKALVSYLSCFAGGVFLGACLLHLLAEGTRDMAEYFEEIGKDVEFPVFEAIAGVGFFLIAVVEQTAHKMLHRIHPQRAPPDDNGTPVGSPITTIFNKDLEHDQTPEADGKHKALSQNPCSVADVPLGQDENHTHGTCEIVEAIQSGPIKAFLLLTALSFHTVFDGLAVGLETSISNVWQIFLAVLVHKCLVSFSLGLQLFMAFPHNHCKAFLWMTFFSLIAPIGVGIGIAVTSGQVDELAKSLVSIILQGVATGIFLYVTFFEILKEELMEKPGFLRLLAAAVGFAAMAIPHVVEMVGT